MENIIIGPVVGVDTSRSVQEHISDILDRGYIPIAVIHNKEDEAFKPFEEQDFNPIAVIITVKYKQAYE